MIDKKYPYIGENTHSVKFLVYSKNLTLILNSVNKGKRHATYLERKYKNITREYLSNTYGKCESQEHADFIYSLADNHGIEVYSNHHIFDDKSFFYFCDNELHLECDDFEIFARNTNKKLIHLPLPPKEKEMEETKPIYTKEMHERGEFPAIGAKVKYPPGEGVISVDEPDESGVIVVLDSHYKEYKRVALAAIKPISTIEDELTEFFKEQSGMQPCDLAKYALAKFNITPKAQK